MVSSSGAPVDTEKHMLLQCCPTVLKRRCFLARLACLVPSLATLDQDQLAQVILCPATAQTAKLTNKYIKILCDARQMMDEGVPPDQLGYRHSFEDDDISSFASLASVD